MRVQDHYTHEACTIEASASLSEAARRGLTVRRRLPDEAVAEREATVVLELSKRRQPCYVLDAISPDLKTAIRDRCGFYARVLQPGAVRPGETIEVDT